MWIKLAEKHTTAIFALVPSKKDAKTIYESSDNQEGTEKAKDLHITLIFLGEKKDLDKEKLIEIGNKIASQHKPLIGELSGTGRFWGSGEEDDALYYSYDCVELPQFRQDLLKACMKNKQCIKQTHGFAPHLTLRYIDKTKNSSYGLPAKMPLEFDSFYLLFGEEKIEFKLS